MTTAVGDLGSRYRILERIGAGGMGEVYRAEDTLLGRRVAVKVLQAEVSRDPRRRRRFLAEARAASALNHRGIVTIHDVVRVNDVDHIVMELVEGESLDRKVTRDGLPEAVAIRYGIQIADALAAAHAAGVIHRDLKPSNVMVTADGGVKVLDFGLARRDSTAPDAQTAPMTREGGMIGTYEFMSPEQVLGEPTDARSDIFSFGILLYELLAGRRPFRGKSVPSLLHAVAYEEPPPLATARPGVSPRLAEIVERTLAKRPALRFQTMAEVAAALQQVLAGIPSDPGECSTNVPTVNLGRTEAPAVRSVRRPIWRRVHLRSRAAAAAGLLIAVAVVLSIVAGRTGVLARISPVGWGGSSTVKALEPYQLYERGMASLARYDLGQNIDHAIEDFERMLAVDGDSGPALAGLARAYWIDGVSGSLDSVRLDQALGVAERAVESGPLLADAWVSRGLVYQELGRFEEAGRDFERALELEPNNAAAFDGLGRLDEARGDLAAAEESFRKAIELEPEGWDHYAQLGTVLHRQGRYEDAERVLSAAVEAVPDCAVNHRNLGVVYYMQGKPAEAASSFQKALRIEPDPWLYSNLGTIQFAQGLYPQAVSAFEKAIESGGAHSYPVWANLADAYRWTPDNEEKARDTYSTALQLLDEKLEEKPEDPTLLTRKALYLAKRGDRDAARRQVAKALTLEGLDAGAWYRLGVAREILGERDEAIETLDRALREGYSRSDLESDPELRELRKDPEYHRRLARLRAR